MSGRMQMTQYFEKHVHAKLEGKPPEAGIGEDAVMGAAQLAFNLIHTELVHAYVEQYHFRYIFTPETVDW
jgi:hypothetical protein